MPTLGSASVDARSRQGLTVDHLSPRVSWLGSWRWSVRQRCTPVVVAVRGHAGGPIDGSNSATHIEAHGAHRPPPCSPRRRAFLRRWCRDSEQIENPSLPLPLLAT
ncbi:hypothetical protein VPH35_051569 [Triticum aestivum]